MSASSLSSLSPDLSAQISDVMGALKAARERPAHLRLVDNTNRVSPVPDARGRGAEVLEETGKALQARVDRAADQELVRTFLTADAVTVSDAVAVMAMLKGGRRLHVDYAMRNRAAQAAVVCVSNALDDIILERGALATKLTKLTTVGLQLSSQRNHMIRESAARGVSGGLRTRVRQLCCLLDQEIQHIGRVAEEASGAQASLQAEEEDLRELLRQAYAIRRSVRS